MERISPNDPETFLQFSAATQRFAVFRHCRRHPSGAPPNRGSKVGAWLWTSQQIRECGADPFWVRVGLIDKLREALASALGCIGRRTHSLYFTPPIEPAVLEFRGIPRNRRVDLRNRQLILFRRCLSEG